MQQLARPAPRRRPASAITAVILVLIGGACGAATHRATPAVHVTAPPAATTGSLLLAELDGGVGAVRAGRTVPLWREAGAVAALDGSAVFSVRTGSSRNATLARLDPRTGATLSNRPVDPGLSIAAVAPVGRWVALTDRTPGYGSQGRASTRLVVIDGRSGVVVRRLSLTGDVQPEAFSTDGQLVFALDYRVDHYRVQTIELATGFRHDTNDRDKQPPEDMHGQAVHGVMSTDRTLLATLYRDPGNHDEPAFVHVLDLTNGWSYCADLVAPFGTGAPGSDAIRLMANGTVEIGTTSAPRIAVIHIDAVHDPRIPVQVAYRAGTLPPPPAWLAQMPGFDFVISPAGA